MPYKLLERKYIINKVSYHPCKMLVAIFSAVEELLKSAYITGTLYTQNQAVNIACVIIQSTGKFVLAICEWNYIPIVQNKWVGFKQFFKRRTANHGRIQISPCIMR